MILLVDQKRDPAWAVVMQAALSGSGAELTQAVSNMLEILPAGMHKWVGMDVLLKALQLDASQVCLCCCLRAACGCMQEAAPRSVFALRCTLQLDAVRSEAPGCLTKLVGKKQTRSVDKKLSGNFVIP